MTCCKGCTLPANALRDASRHVTSGGTPLSLFYFSAGDKVRWNDRNADSHWDRGDELWIDVDGDNKYSAGDKVIFDHDSNLNVANNTAGIAVDAQTEFRYVRKTLTNTVGTYTEGDYIYTTYFNWELYTAIRDNVLAHEALGHPTQLPHDTNYAAYTMMISANPFSYTANGMYVRDNFGTRKYSDPPTTFNKSDQDTLLQVRE